MLRSTEVFSELIELCRELRYSVSQQLLYYRASVYKAEALPLVAKKIEQLRMAATLLLDDNIQECFRDFDFLTVNKCSSSVPGECGLTFRVSKLLKDLDAALTDLQKRVSKRTVELDSTQIMHRFQSKRSDLLLLCQEGSKSWRLFQSL